MILAYFLRRALPTKFAYSLPLVFAAALEPDLDFLFDSFFPHHTITHSIAFWSLFSAPLAIIFQFKVVPYVAATFSHFLKGDLATGQGFTCAHIYTSYLSGKVKDFTKPRYGFIQTLLIVV